MTWQRPLVVAIVSEYQGLDPFTPHAQLLHAENLSPASSEIRRKALPHRPHLVAGLP